MWLFQGFVLHLGLYVSPRERQALEDTVQIRLALCRFTVVGGFAQSGMLHRLWAELFSVGEAQLWGAELVISSPHCQKIQGDKIHPPSQPASFFSAVPLVSSFKRQLDIGACTIQVAFLSPFSVESRESQV